MAYPRYRRARNHKNTSRTAGSVTINGTAWADLPGVGSAMDLTVDASAGDVIEAGVNLRWGSEAVIAYLTPWTINNGVVTNPFVAGGVGGGGAAGWHGPSGVLNPVAGSVHYTLLSGDIYQGTVTVRLRARTDSAVNKTIAAVSDIPLLFSVKNLGPAQS